MIRYMACPYVTLQVHVLMHENIADVSALGALHVCVCVCVCVCVRYPHATGGAPIV